MRGNNAFGLCGPECRYQGLYAGSQASLNDMSAKQTIALLRVARLREGVVDAIKKAYPVQFTEAEDAMGHRMSKADDEILIANLHGFLALEPTGKESAVASALSGAPVVRPATGPDTSDLRRALAECGVQLPAGDDLAQWALAVKSWGGRTGTSPQTVVAPPAQPGSAPVVRVSDNRIRHEDPTPDYFTEPGPAPAGPVSSLEDLFAVDPGPEPEPEPADEGDGYFDLAAALEYDSVPVATDGADVPLADDSHLTSPAPEDPAVAADHSPAAPAPDPAPVTASNSTGSGLPSLAALFADDEPAGEPLTAGSLEEVMALANPTTAPSAAAEPERPARRSRSQVDGPLKPTLFPTAAGGAKAPRAKAVKPPKRTTRVSAAAPESHDEQAMATAAAGGQLTDALDQQLVAAVCIPRPVFTSDLAHMLGDTELVAAWEKKYRSMGTTGPMRFIMAKPRHRERGNLVIPFAKDLRKVATEFDKSLWSRCLNDLKGAKLYEVAVLLHRFADQIVTAEVKENTVTLRINQQRGLVGVVVALDTDLDAGDDTRTAVAQEVEELMATRLSLLAVLTITAGNKALSDLGEALRAEASERSWSVTAPVIAAHSWDFASDGGASAISVLG